MAGISVTQRLLFRLIRQEKGYSIENMANAMKISKSALSKMENGKKLFSLNNFKIGMNHMGVCFQTLPQTELQQIKKLIAKFIEGAYFSDQLQKKRVHEQFLELNFNRHQDFHEGYFYLVILEAILEIDELPEFAAIETLQTPLVKRMRLLEKAILELPADLQNLYVYMVILWLTRSHQWIAVERFFQSLHLNQEIPEFPGLITLIASYRVNALAAVPTKDCNPYQLICQLRRIVHNEGNYLRLIYLDFNEAVYFLTTGNYSFAKKKLEQLQKAIWRFNLETLKSPVKTKLAWCDLMMQNFEVALEELKKVEIEFGYNFLENCLPFGVYCAYRQGDLSEANDIFLRLQAHLLNKKDLEILQIFSPLLKMATLPFGFERRQWLNIFCTHCEAHWNKLLKNLPQDREEAIFFIQIQLYEMEIVHDYSEANRLYRTLDLLNQTRPKLEPFKNSIA